MVEKIGGALRLAAVDPAARRLGLTPGMTLADAQARTPALRTVVHRPIRDDALLTAALEDFGRFTPMIAPDPPHGLMLDVTGCAHLFGGEAGLMRRVQARAADAGLQIRLALAGTPQCARALARFGPGGRFAPGQDRAAARRLPVAALELPVKAEQALRRAGLKRLADLDDRPRAPLAARFGADFSARLARVLGDDDVRITPHRPPPPIVVDRVFLEPLSAPEDVERVLSDLLAETADRLDQVGQGARAFEAGFYRVDGKVRRIVVRAGRPTRDAGVVLRLFRERLAALAHPLDPGFGFDQMRMAVTAAEALAPVQGGLVGGPHGDRPNEEDFGRLIDRLTARLGPEAVLRFAPQESHIPERAQRLVPAGAAKPESDRAEDWAEDRPEDWPAPDPDAPPLRPLQMFHPPQPVETMAEVPDGSPMRFRWRRVLHEVVRSEGPERIGGEWWRAPDQRTRDYYRVEDRTGRRFWLFRQGLYGETDEPRWFIHGLFA
ncbi:DNA polymerase Y family protein [uncultured Brevundimonas sp.]|uniref:DNA polymerase Y family protein n=1 Tax=uncultured Brevundimonas sp. TaxID=213418 RepID=UPI003424B429